MLKNPGGADGGAFLGPLAEISVGYRMAQPPPSICPYTACNPVQALGSPGRKTRKFPDSPTSLFSWLK